MLMEWGHSENFMPKRHSVTLSSTWDRNMTKISFKGVRILNISIIMDMISKTAIISNNGELKAIYPSSEEL